MRSVDAAVAAADLALTFTVDNSAPEAGFDTITFTAKITNNGPALASATVSFAWPAPDLQQGTVDDQAGTTYATAKPATGEWDVPNLANGSSATVTIQATTINVGEFISTASVTSNVSDPTPPGAASVTVNATASRHIVSIGAAGDDALLITCNGPHSLVGNETIEIAGNSEAAYNTTFMVNGETTTTLTFTTTDKGVYAGDGTGGTFIIP